MSVNPYQDARDALDRIEGEVESLTDRIAALEGTGDVMSAAYDAGLKMGQKLSTKADKTSGSGSLVERVADEVGLNPIDASAAIRAVADWCEEKIESHGYNTLPSMLRAELEEE